MELLAVAADEDVAPDDAGAVPGFGGRFMTLLVEIRDPHKEVQKVRVCSSPLVLFSKMVRRGVRQRHSAAALSVKVLTINAM